MLNDPLPMPTPPEHPPAATPTLIGFIESIAVINGHPHLSGWAIDTANPAEPVRLTVLIAGEPHSDIICDLPRPDLVGAGQPRTDAGFLWPAPPITPGPLTLRGPGGEAIPTLPALGSPDAIWAAAAEAAPPAPQTPPQPPLFDEPFYSAANPDVAAANDPAWDHFHHRGFAEWRDPSPLFNLATYAAAGPPLDPAENPLLHFARIGRAEGRRHHWLFDAREYLRLHPDLPPDHDALAHLLGHGLAENRQPALLFDPVYYLSRYPDIAAAGMPALTHFLRSGDREGRAPHPLFDPAFYRQQAGDLGNAGHLEHFLRTGGRTNPHPLFDTAFYRATQPDADAARTPLHHYIETGAPRGADPHPAFNTAHYLRTTPDPAARRNPLRHYIEQGAPAGLSPNPLFDPAFYAAQPRRRTWDGKPLPRTGPRISIIVPVHDTPAPILRECIESVLAQTYASWELCILDDASRDPATAATLAAYRGRDPRIRIDRSPANLHIARATNRAALQATGAYLAFLDHDDTIEPDALAEIAAALTADDTIDLLYTDEDKLDPAGVRTEPYHKPDWSPEHLHSVMYVLHMLVLRKSLFWDVGGARPERTGAQDYDLALRAAARARRVHHIPRILYHWRMNPGSAAGDVGAKPYALEAARAALQDAVAETMPGAEIEHGLLRGTFRVRPSLAASPPVTLLILTNDRERDIPGRGRLNLVQNFVASIAEKTTYTNYQLVVVDDANSSPETEAAIHAAGGRIVQYRHPGPFNYARKANFATAAATTEHIVHLNDDMEIITPGWLEALLELSTRPGVGAAGARLLYPDGRIQHSGIVLGVNGAAGHAFVHLDRDIVGYNAYTHLIRNYSAVTGAVLATRRSILDAVGGYDERLAIDFNDIDLCLRLGQAGHRIAFTPYAELFHFEGSSAVRTAQNPAERDLFLSRWQPLVARDPFYNPNLPRDRLGFA